MKELLKKIKLPIFASSAIKYTAANFLNAIVPILLLPILTAYLSKEEYGLVAIFQVMVMATLPIVGLNSQSAVEREFFSAKYNFKKYVSNACIILLISGSIVLLVTLILGDVISSLSEFPSELLWVVPIYCICHNICEIQLTVWRVKNRPSAYGLFRIARTFVEIGLSVLLVTVLTKGWIGRIEGMLWAAVLFGLMSIVFLFREGSLIMGLSKTYVKDIITFGVPLIPHTLGGIVMIYSDRIFITKMIGIADTGAYTVGFQVAMAISLLQSSFNLAWIPWFYDRLNQKDDRINIQIVRITYWYFLIILICTLILTLVAPMIFEIFIHKSYHDAIQFVFWIALGFSFDGMYKMVVNYIFYLKKTYIISIITLFTALLNLVLNYFFITSFAAIGAAKATALCLFFEFIVVWFISSRIYPMPWRLR